MKQSNTYKEAVDYLYKQLPMFQRIGKKAFKKDLTNILNLCHQLDNPHQKFKSIHIAGTNGKGSVSHMVAAILQAHGLKVGLYTSPHYKDFRERIKINGKKIPQRAVVDFVAQIKGMSSGIMPSFFEISVAMAFEYFAKEKVDFAVIETGLGGRLDSTNIIDPEISVITNISYDHMEFLGNTLEAIAGEKSGIIKQNKPVIIGEYQAEIEHVFRTKASSMQSDLFYARDMVEIDRAHIMKYAFYGDANRKPLAISLNIPFASPYFNQNAITTLGTISQLSKTHSFDLDTDKITHALEHLYDYTSYIGRWQKISKMPDIIIDSAHNEAGLKVILEEVDRLDYSKVHFILGFVKDKSLDSILTLFPSGAYYYFAKASIPRGLDSKELKEKASGFGLKGRYYTSVKNALKAAKRKAAQSDLIYVGGSIFVVAEVI